MLSNLLSGIFSYRQEKDHHIFFSNFVEIDKLFKLFSENEKIRIIKLILEKGHDINYRFYNQNNLPKINSVKDLIQVIEDLKTDELEFTDIQADLGNNLFVSIYENVLNLYFLKFDERTMREFTLRLFMEIENFDFDSSIDLVNLMLESPNQIIEIDPHGKTLKFYKDMAEYRLS